MPGSPVVNRASVNPDLGTNERQEKLVARAQNCLQVHHATGDVAERITCLAQLRRVWNQFLTGCVQLAFVERFPAGSCLGRDFLRSRKCRLVPGARSRQGRAESADEVPAVRFTTCWNSWLLVSAPWQPWQVFMEKNLLAAASFLPIPVAFQNPLAEGNIVEAIECRTAKERRALTGSRRAPAEFPGSQRFRD